MKLFKAQRVEFTEWLERKFGEQVISEEDGNFQRWYWQDEIVATHHNEVNFLAVTDMTLLDQWRKEEKIPELVQEWFFSFGFDHTTETGYPLRDKYLKVVGTYGEAREIVVRHRGAKWAFQYNTEEELGVERFGLAQITLGAVSLEGE